MIDIAMPVEVGDIPPEGTICLLRESQSITAEAIRTLASNWRGPIPLRDERVTTHKTVGEVYEVWVEDGPPVRLMGRYRPAATDESVVADATP